MACSYYYKGKLIGNELLLTDFLLEKRKYISSMGDRVFEFTPRALDAMHTLENEVLRDGKAKKAQLNKYVASHGVTYNEDGEVIMMEKPAMGVNKFLSKYRDDKGQRIEPEFIEKEYWNRRFEAWKQVNPDTHMPSADNFTEDEIQTIKEIDPSFNPETTYSETEFEEWKKAITAKWTAQGQTGSALHAVSELFFGKNSAGEYIYDVFAADSSLITNYYNLQFKNKKDEYGKITYGDFVTLDLFKKMVDMCQKLKKQITDKYGECTFYPEFTITALTSQEVEGCNQLVGIIDLLVVDSRGRTHIYDYKTSPKPYNKYASAKKLAFILQLAVYDRILQKYGINTLDGTCQIIPIQLNNFHWTGDKYEFDDISYEIGEDTVETRDLTNQIHVSNKLNRQLGEFLPVSLNLNPKSQNLLQKVSEATKKWFPTYQMMKNQTDEELQQMLDKAGAYKPNKAGQLSYQFSVGFQDPIAIDIAEAGGLDQAKVKLFNEVKKTIQSWTYRKHALTSRFVEAFNAAVKNGTNFELEGANGVVTGNSLWLQETMSPYCNGDYDIYEDDASLNLGIIYLQNKKSGAITVLKLTGSKLDYQHYFLKGRTNINGKYAPDVEENSKGNSLMLKSINANIEAMEAMLALLNTEFLGPCNVREIKVINPYTLTGMPVSNKELLYTWKNLVEKENVLGTDENKFAGPDPKIKMLEKVEDLRFKFYEVLEDESFSTNPEKFMDIRRNMEGLDWNATDSDLYRQLNDLRIQLEQAYPNQLKEVRRNISDLNRPENQLYNAIMSTMLELKNIDVRLQIEDADNWLQNKSFTGILREGWEGLNLENPGNFRSAILNQLTKSVGNVYLKVKDYLNRLNVEIRKLVEDLKKQKNFGWIKSEMGNATDMYKNMIEHTPDGEILFVNPNTLQGAEKKFLEYALKTINKDRWNESDATLESWKNSAVGSADYLKYYRVPLMRASIGSKMSTTDYINSMRSRLKTWTPKGALDEMQAAMTGFFDEESKKLQDDKTRIFEMTNKFDAGEGEHRLEIIKARGVDDFEHNIENLLLAHSYAYSLKREMDKEMPLIKASALTLSMLGAGANFGKDGNFTNLIDFVEKYVKAKVKNESINSESMRKWEALSGKARNAASFLALAFSPLQFTYQSLEGIWKACSLIIKKPDGTDTFTAKNMWDAFRATYKDSAHYSDKPTLCQRLNEAYGLNDMDSNQFASRISSDKGIWTHFTDFAFKFASRPDFYNRMTIWGAQMRADGTWDAHHIGKDGELVYDFSKDKRYAAMKTAPKDSVEYKQALSKYLAALEQFLREGVTNPDGSELKFGDDLPRAYTNQEAQGMKAIADGMYGYYNHENLSMMNSMFLGSLATQMKTYWSAKKNQYLAPGGVKLVGHWEDYLENGLQMYYAKNESGEIDLSGGMVTAEDPNCSGVKVTRWKGQWLEGIVSTLWNFGSNWVDKGFKEAWNGMYNVEDENLRTAYRSNLKHLAIDLFLAAFGMVLMGLVLQPWDDEYKKEFYKDLGNTNKATDYMLSHFVALTIDHSFMDFNFLDSIFKPTLDWQPFAFSSLQRIATNGWNCVTGDLTFINGLANTMAIARQTKPLLKSLVYEDL